VARGGRGAASVAHLAAQGLLSHPILYGVPARVPWLALGETPFHGPWAPRDMDAVQAGVLRSAAALADDEANTRRSTALELMAALEEIPAVTMVTPPTGDGTSPGWLRLPVMLSPQRRAHAGEQAFRRLGVVPGYPLSLPTLPAFAKPSDISPGATFLASSVITLPVHRWVTREDRDRIVRLLAL
jgi:dTDP-4-amino-4,6-dideoxygalactose transaminase